VGVKRIAQMMVLAVAVAGCGAGASSAEPRATATPSLAVATPSPADTRRPTATPQPTAVPVPAKPTGVTFKVVRQVETKNGHRETYRVTWKAPRTDGIEIRVLGVTECLSAPRHPKPGVGPCLVPHTALPASVLEPIAKAPASAGKVTWTWDTIDYCDTYEYVWKADPPPDGRMYFAVVLAAYAPSGHSIFAIAFPGSWSVPGPEETAC
jgi:hypothetical protein